MLPHWSIRFTRSGGNEFTGPTILSNRRFRKEQISTNPSCSAQAFQQQCEGELFSHCADRLGLAVALTEVRNELAVIANVNVKSPAVGHFTRRRRRRLYQTEIQKQTA